MSNSDSILAHDKFLFKMGCEFVFLVFFEELMYTSTRLKVCKDYKAGCQKKNIFAHRILDFHFFFLLIVLHYVIFNVTFQI
jgi:hypothetical protein